MGPHGCLFFFSSEISFQQRGEARTIGFSYRVINERIAVRENQVRGLHMPLVKISEYSCWLDALLGHSVRTFSSTFLDHHRDEDDGGKSGSTFCDFSWVCIGVYVG